MCAIVCVLGLSGLHGLGAQQRQPTATGVVFHDANRNGVRDADEVGIANVRVSNGREIVPADRGGAYRLPIDDDAILFVIKPRGWMTPVDALNLPRFYYIHKPKGSPKLKYPGVAPTGPLPRSVDFPLYPQSEPDRFRVIVFGDTQPTSMEDIQYLAHDIVEPLIGTDAAFGFTLGDIVGDKLELHEPLNRVVAHIGIPWYNVMGNHDSDYSSPDDKHSDEHFERVYGPSYYSFDYGPVHFIVLDDIVWYGATEEKKGYYRAGLGEQQLEFVRNDLALVPRDQLVVLNMHIPIVQIKEHKELFKLLAEHPHTLSFSAHTHINEHLFLGPENDWPGAQPHHHVNFVTACGGWWTGAPDEVGIPHTTMPDGAPNGWSVVTFEGHRYSVVYRAARRPADYQMSIYTPESVPAGKAGETEVLVNVFAGSERSTVEMRFAKGAWVKLKRVAREDPYYVAIKQAEESKHPPRGRKLPQAGKSPHIWLGTLPANPPPGTHLIEVRTTDMFGHTDTAGRIIRIE
ncbi:MAG: calcineurin-like phosphoesterase C-terminal domain-containing protein [Phycisphaerae bacterium]